MGVGFFVFFASVGFSLEMTEDSDFVAIADSGVQSNFSPFHDSQMIVDFVRGLSNQLDGKEAGREIKLPVLSNDYLQERLSLIFASYQPAALWENKDWFLSFGPTHFSSGEPQSFVILAWKKNTSAQSLDLEDLTRLYLDETMAEIKDSEDLKSWQEKRNQVMSAFISLRHSKASYELFRLSPESRFGEEGFRLQPEAPIENEPVVFRIFPEQLLSSLTY